MINDISKLIRLKDKKIRGNFVIKPHTYDMYRTILNFFYNKEAKTILKFKDLLDIPPFQNQLKEDIANNKTRFPIITKSYAFVYTDFSDKKNWQFIIQYDSLQELLKLREIFKVRASAFDTKLIEKRGYNPFTEQFYNDLLKPVEKIIR